MKEAALAYLDLGPEYSCVFCMSNILSPSRPGGLLWLMQLLIAADVECCANEYYGFQLKTFVWLRWPRLCRSQ